MKKWLAGLGVLTVLTIGVVPALASHSWAGYHWARTANPFTVKLGDNLTSDWRSYLQTASSDWSKSTVMDTTIVAGQARGRCKATSGRVEVCNGAYGQNGWLGLASINVSQGHITQGTVKVNDTYFAQAKYNNTAEKLHVMCQEVGHTFGLDHQDESGASLNTCMDYYQNTSNSDTKSTHPNAHDYDELLTIYSHLDSTATLGTSAGPSNAPEWAPGASRASKYVEHLANGDEQITFVIWADA